MRVRESGDGEMHNPFQMFLDEGLKKALFAFWGKGARKCLTND